MENFATGSLDRPVETAVTVHDDESERFVVHEEFVEIFGVELVVAEVEGSVDGFERFKVDVYFAFFSFVCDYCSTVKN